MGTDTFRLTIDKASRGGVIAAGTLQNRTRAGPPEQNTGTASGGGMGLPIVEWP
jgi:hypothetical protein